MANGDATSMNKEVLEAIENLSQQFSGLQEEVETLKRDQNTEHSRSRSRERRDG